MNEEPLTLMALIGAGGVVAGGLALSGRGVARPSLWYEQSWPRKVAPEAVAGFFRQLAGDQRRHVVACELVAQQGQLCYRLGLAEQHSEAIIAALSSHIPGASASLIEHDTRRAPQHVWQLSLSSTHRALRTSDPLELARALTSALSSASERHTVILQTLLGPRLSPAKAPASGSTEPASTWSEAIKQAAGKGHTLDAEEHRAYKEKATDLGFRAVVRIGVDAPTARAAKAIVLEILGALRGAEAPGVHLALEKDDPAKLAAARHPRSWPLAFNVRELTCLCGWPLGSEALPGVQRARARLVPAAQSVSREGRIVGLSTTPGQSRPLAISVTDSLQHLHLIGPTGTGKSTLLLNLIVQDMVDDRAVILIDPKGDLAADVLLRVPERRAGDVVVLDPADESRHVGLNVLRAEDRPAELLADQVLAIFHDLYRDSWGPRTQDILHAALLTLANRPHMTLCALPLLLANPRFRKKVVAELDDQVALVPFWQAYERQSDSARQQAIAPVMTRLRAFLLRPRMRAVIGQAEPAFELGSVFSEHKILLVSLAKGLLGPECAELLGSLVFAQVWQAACGRISMPVSERTPTMIYIDEFQDAVHGVTDLADMLAQARGLGCGLTLAHQHLAQLPAELRSAVLANARSRICFQLGSEDARVIATSSELEATDLQNLGRYEIYCSLVGEGNVNPYASGRTLAPEEPTTDAGKVRAASRLRYGRDLDAIEAELATLVGDKPAAEQPPIGRRRQP